jgi:hypothetical protein
MNFSEKTIRNLDGEEFNGIAVELFHRTLACNPVYREFCEALRTDPRDVTHFASVPFLPVGFFKTRKVYSSEKEPEKIFLSSGTTGMERSAHHVADLDLYRRSLTESFRHFNGNPSDYVIGALTPTPEENPDSSLIYMISELMSHTSGAFLSLDTSVNDPLSPLRPLRSKKKKCMLIGLTYALLDVVEKGIEKDPSLIIVETGGMKGRRKEMIREELHERLKAGFGVEKIHSEYGMSELLSQAWSQGDGLYRCPPWMKVLFRDVNDPLSFVPFGQSGGINIIDLANVNSCPFIATQDLGKVNTDGSFEVLGRFDYSDVRGCSLMI